MNCEDEFVNHLATGYRPLTTSATPNRVNKMHTSSGSVSLHINSFSLEPLPLFRLTAIGAPAFFLFVAAHACTESDIHSRRCLEAEALCNLDKIELMNIKD